MWFISAIKWIPLSYWIHKRMPKQGIISVINFFATVVALACLVRDYSVHSLSMQTITKHWEQPRAQGKSIKSIWNTAKDSVGLGELPNVYLFLPKSWWDLQVVYWEIIWLEILWMSGQNQLSCSSLTILHLYLCPIWWEISAKSTGQKERGYRKSIWPNV